MGKGFCNVLFFCVKNTKVMFLHVFLLLRCVCAYVIVGFCVLLNENPAMALMACPAGKVKYLGRGGV